jgi:hypothetical protein
MFQLNQLSTFEVPRDMVALAARGETFGRKPLIISPWWTKSPAPPDPAGVPGKLKYDKHARTLVSEGSIIASDCLCDWCTKARIRKAEANKLQKVADNLLQWADVGLANPDWAPLTAEKAKREAQLAELDRERSMILEVLGSSEVRAKDQWVTMLEECQQKIREVTGVPARYLGVDHARPGSDVDHLVIMKPRQIGLTMQERRHTQMAGLPGAPLGGK